MLIDAPWEDVAHTRMTAAYRVVTSWAKTGGR